MKESINVNKSQFLTLEQFAQKNPWPQESTLRNLYYKRKSNGLEKAFIKVGRRIIVDEEMFFALIKSRKVSDSGKS